VTRPTALTIDPDGIPEALRREPRWACWRYEWQQHDGKSGRWSKIPYQPNNRAAKSNNPATWGSCAEALAASPHFDGLLFALGDGWSGLDLDKCIDGKAVALDALPCLAQLDALSAYQEVSPSGTGYKVVGRASRIGGEINFEKSSRTAWQGARFFAITGVRPAYLDLPRDPLADLSHLIDAWFPPTPEATSRREGYTLAAECSDDDLLVAAVANETTGDEFLALWRGETTAYGHDHSRADLALCCHLAFWTNYDAERIDRLFRLSGLMRPKWEHASYRRATLGRALR